MKDLTFNRSLFSMAFSNKQWMYRLNIRDASKQIGISAPTLSRLQHEKMPDLITYQKCCKWLNVDMDFFFEEYET